MDPKWDAHLGRDSIFSCTTDLCFFFLQRADERAERCATRPAVVRVREKGRFEPQKIGIYGGLFGIE